MRAQCKDSPLVPFVGVHTFRPPHGRFTSQQTTARHAVLWAIQLAIRLRRRGVTILSDNEVAIA